MDYFRIIFIIEAVINTITGISYIILPYHNLRLMISINESNAIQDLLSRFWGVMILVQASILIYGAVEPVTRFSTYIALTVGEVLMIPIIIHYILLVTPQTNICKRREIIFIAILFVFIGLRICYFVLRSQGLTN